MTYLRWIGRRFRRMLIVAGLAVAFSAACTVAVPALATNEYYKCNSCAETNGPENGVKNNFTINHSGKGVCAALWRNNGGGNFTLMADECRSGGETAHNCIGSQVTGHGEAESESGNSLLLGRQDNISACE